MQLKHIYTHVQDGVLLSYGVPRLFQESSDLSEPADKAWRGLCVSVIL